MHLLMNLSFLKRFLQLLFIDPSFVKAALSSTTAEVSLAQGFQLVKFLTVYRLYSSAKHLIKMPSCKDL